MRVLPALKSEIDYAKDLVGAGLEAASSVAKGTADPKPMASLAHVSRIALAPAALCAAAGVLGAFLIRKGRPGQDALLGGLLGCAVGFGGGIAWETRDRTSAFALNATKNVQAVRDAHWLERNPIAYA